MAADALWTVALAWPPLFAALTGRELPHFVSPVRQVFWLASLLMAGWTLILAWTAFDPVPRRIVLLISICPVFVGLLGISLYSLLTDSLAAGWIVCKTAFLLCAVLSAYLMANTLVREE